MLSVLVIRQRCVPVRTLRSFPTRRSSDLLDHGQIIAQREVAILPDDTPESLHARIQILEDRKSTRLNSSHGYISYAVFCLKKKTYYALNQFRPGDQFHPCLCRMSVTHETT